MKVLLINGSPNKSYGITSFICKPFVDGLQNAGADIETLYTASMKINPCAGKLICWKRRDNTCFQKDNMGSIIDKIKLTDLIIIASPVHSDGVTGTLKNFFDRLLPLKQAVFTEKNGRCRHVNHLNQKMPKLLLVSSCGFYEVDNFMPMLNHIRAICANYGFEYCGSLLRPHSLLFKLLNNERTDDIKKALYESGLNFIKKGFISHESYMRILQEITSKEEYFYIINEYFEQAGNKKVYYNSY